MCVYEQIKYGGAARIRPRTRSRGPSSRSSPHPRSDIRYLPSRPSLPLLFTRPALLEHARRTTFAINGRRARRLEQTPHRLTRREQADSDAEHDQGDIGDLGLARRGARAQMQEGRVDEAQGHAVPSATSSQPRLLDNEG
jgi:hypothetical protein